MPVLADTSVLNYLILLDQLALLPTLYGRVIVPTVVLTVELPHPDAPAPVRAWVAQRTVHPPWLERRAPTRQPAAALLVQLAPPAGAHVGLRALHLAGRGVEEQRDAHLRHGPRLGVGNLDHRPGGLQLGMVEPLVRGDA